MKDPSKDIVIEEIREARCRISKKCGNDVSRLVDHLQNANVKYARQVQMYEKGRKGSVQRHAPVVCTA